MLMKSSFTQTPPRENLKFLPDHEHNLPHKVQHKSHVPKLMVTSVSQPTDTLENVASSIMVISFPHYEHHAIDLLV